MDLRSILMGMAFVIMWSSAFTSARMIVADAPPLTALALRFLLSGLIGVGLARLMGQSWRLTPYRQTTQSARYCFSRDRRTVETAEMHKREVRKGT